MQVLWLARMYLLDEPWQFWTFFVLVAAELAVPVWAESHRRTSWHPHHIAERFGLFTLLLLGESLLASANAMIDALGEGEHIPELLALAACGTRRDRRHLVAVLRARAARAAEQPARRASRSATCTT